MKWMPCAEQLSTALAIFVVAVAAIEDGVIGTEDGGELVDGLFGGITRRNHQPHRPWRSELADEFGEGGARNGSSGCRCLDCCWVAVIDDQRMPALYQARGHIRAHFT